MELTNEHINYGNNPNSETEMEMDNNIIKSFNYWVDIFKAEITEEEFKKYMSKREEVIKDFSEIISERLKKLVK